MGDGPEKWNSQVTASLTTQGITCEILRNRGRTMKVRKLCEPYETGVSRLSLPTLSGVPSARNRLFVPVPVVETAGCIPSPLRGDSPDYRERHADKLSKEPPRIPSAKKAADF
jgi:hypothetical protein